MRLSFVKVMPFYCPHTVSSKCFLHFRNIGEPCSCSVAQSCPTLCDPVDWTWSSRLLRPWNFPDKNTRVGCHFLLQGIFLVQGLNSGLSYLWHWQVGSLPLSLWGASYKNERYISLLNEVGCFTSSHERFI